MKKIIVIILLLLSTPVWACDSYEDCMDQAAFTVPGVTIGYGYKINGKAVSESITKETAYLKSISYKLDEISKMLVKNNTDAK